LGQFPDTGTVGRPSSFVRVADYPDGILPRDLLRGGLGYLRRARCVNFDEFI
jgi:hypothetical protein